MPELFSRRTHCWQWKSIVTATQHRNRLRDGSNHHSAQSCRDTQATVDGEAVQWPLVFAKDKACILDVIPSQ